MSLGLANMYVAWPNWGVSTTTAFSKSKIFVATQTNPSSAARELVVEEPVVVRTPANLSNVEIVWDPEI